MTVDASTFDLQEYCGLVKSFLRKGYELVGYESILPNRRHLLLRHDIDFDLDAAVTMARVEASHSMSANYFVLLRTEFYNPFSPDALSALQEITALGHRVGLHFDASLYEHAEDLPDQANHECELLSGIIGREVDILSLHRPHPDLLSEGFNVPGRLNAYSSRFFHEIAYCSDSRGGWHHGSPLENEAVARGSAIQLLTHPIWWVGEKRSPLDRLHQLKSEHDERLDRALAKNCDVWS